MLSGFENTEDAYGLMTQLWDRTIELLMQEVTAMKGNHSSCSLNSNSKPLWQSRQPRQTFLKSAGSHPDIRKVGRYPKCLLPLLPPNFLNFFFFYYQRGHWKPKDFNRNTLVFSGFQTLKRCRENICVGGTMGIGV
jgi:hypothetical protein